MTTESQSAFGSTRNDRLSRRLHDVTWGLLLLMTGVIWQLPSSDIPDGTWLFGVTAILLGLNVVRYVKGIGVNGPSLGLGLVALFVWLTRIAPDRPLLGVCFILIGVGLLVKPLLTRPREA
jgi:hypothetical protein